MQFMGIHSLGNENIDFYTKEEIQILLKDQTSISKIFILSIEQLIYSEDICFLSRWQKGDKIK